MDNIMNVSEVQLSYKSNVKSSTRYKINSSQDAYELLIKCFPDDTIEYKESFKVVLLNQSNRVLGIVPISEEWNLCNLCRCKVDITSCLTG